MKKGKKRYSRQRKSTEESPTAPFRQVAQVGMGAGMVSTMTPLMSNPSQANLGNAMGGMVGFGMLAPMASVGFDAIDRMGAKKKKKY